MLPIGLPPSLNSAKKLKPNQKYTLYGNFTYVVKLWVEMVDKKTGILNSFCPAVAILQVTNHLPTVIPNKTLAATGDRDDLSFTVSYEGSDVLYEGTTIPLHIRLCNNGTVSKWFRCISILVLQKVTLNLRTLPAAVTHCASKLPFSGYKQQTLLQVNHSPSGGIDVGPHTTK